MERRMHANERGLPHPIIGLRRGAVSFSEGVRNVLMAGD